MCGIHAVLCDSALSNPPVLSQTLRQSLVSRGPDHFGQVQRDVPTGTRTLHAVFTSTVLALRGDHVAAQPLEDAATGSVLCWNGEAWRVGDELIQGNDGETIFARLRVPDSLTTDAREAHILTVLRSIEGPFAFLYLDAQGKRLYFGRDRLGRRSLLCSQPEDHQFIAFSSIADVPESSWKEVEANGVYSIHLDILAAAVGSGDLNACVVKHDWVPFADPNMVSRDLGPFVTQRMHGWRLRFKLTTADLQYRHLQYKIAPVGLRS